MTYTITREFTFSASHVLSGLPDGHRCGRLHGHNYRVAVSVTGHGLDAAGFVIDYGDLSLLRDWIDDHLDHRHLNDVAWFPPGFNPTAEHLAYEVAVALVDLVPTLRRLRDAGRVRWRVGVSDTPDTWAWCDLWEGWEPVADVVGFPVDRAAATVTSTELHRYFGTAAEVGGPNTVPAPTIFGGFSSVQLSAASGFAVCTVCEEPIDVTALFVAIGPDAPRHGTCPRNLPGPGP